MWRSYTLEPLQYIKESKDQDILPLQVDKRRVPVNVSISLIFKP